MRIFLSFVSRDSDAAERISHHLRTAGFDVVSGLTEIPPGAHWPSEALRAIKSSDAVVVLLSTTSLASASASFEISAALASQETLLIPVVLEKGLELPFFLRDIHYVDLSNPRHWQEGLDSLVSALRLSGGQWVRLDKEVREALAQEQRVLTLERAMQEVKSETRETVLAKSLFIFSSVVGLLAAIGGVTIGLGSGGLVAGLLAGLGGTVGGVALSTLIWAVIESRSHREQRSLDE